MYLPQGQTKILPHTGTSLRGKPNTSSYRYLTQGQTKILSHTGTSFRGKPNTYSYRYLLQGQTKYFLIQVQILLFNFLCVVVVPGVGRWWGHRGGRPWAQPGRKHRRPTGTRRCLLNQPGRGWVMQDLTRVGLASVPPYWVRPVGHFSVSLV